MKTKTLPPFLSTLLVALPASTSQANLIAYWPFDDGEGLIATDVIGGYDGAISNGTWFTPAKVGSHALQASGGDEVVCDPAAISTTDDLTLSWWMIDNQTSYGTVMDKSFESSASGFDILVRPTSTEDSPLRFRIGGWQAYGGWGSECRLPIDAYEDGEWVHITCVYNSETDTASIYVNGELPANGDLNPKTGIAGDDGYCEGPNNAEASLYLRGGKETFTGVLDDVAMWDRPLTADEVKTVFESGPLAVEVPDVDLAITAFDFASGDEEFTLTWNSIEGANYAIKYSTDLVTWDLDLDDSIAGAAGESTSYTFKASDLGEQEGPVFFRVEKQ